MTEVSFIRHWGDRIELQEARGELQPRLVLPTPDYSDREHEDIFCEAQATLGLEDLEPTYEGGKTKLIAPYGYMFKITGAFTIWPDGNDITWGYGAPADSYEEWRRQNEGKLQSLEEQGFSPEKAEYEVASWEEGNFDSEPPDIHYFHGKAVTFSFDSVSWGDVTRLGNKKHRSSDDEPASVSVTLEGFKHHWFEQARRFIKLPNSANDRILATHEYGEPGVVPCWQGEHAEGTIEHLQVELVPLEDTECDRYSLPMSLLWVPEKVRWSLFEMFPDLIDQGGDYSNRTNFGGAMRILGELACAMKGSNGNAFDDMAAVSNLAVIDNPMFAHMDTNKLAELVEKMIADQNTKEPPNDEVIQERREKAEEDMEILRKQLVVITNTDQSIHEIVREVGQSDDWLVKHAGYRNLLLDF